MKPTIHWLGAGLSSSPGIVRLENSPHPLVVWNRSLEKAQKRLASHAQAIDVRSLDWNQLGDSLHAGDVVVSMLPANLHPEVAERCLQAGAHFVSSSYLSPAMDRFDEQVKARGLCFVNEVGLDPGIDHLFAHALMDEYRSSDHFSTQHRHAFRSYCGGFPKIPNAFKYKFSWSPLGVLRALKSPAQWIAGGEVRTSQAPWEGLTTYTARLPGGDETFEAFANRDSLPFLRPYGFGEDWNIEEFVRGTLRLDGWSTAWKPIFDELDRLSGESAEQRLAELSRELEQNYAYEPGEPDRVVLCVEMEVHRDRERVWHKSYQLDAEGDDRGPAMARLVSWPVSFAVESILEGAVEPGVTPAPHQPALVREWLQKLENLGECIFVPR